MRLATKGKAVDRGPRDFEKIIMWVLAIFIVYNSLTMKFISIYSVIPLLIQIPLFLALLVNAKWKLPFLGLWALILSINGATMVFGLVLDALQWLLGERGKMTTSLNRILIGWVAIVLATVVYSKILKPQLGLKRIVEQDSGTGG
jgi:hypothetical protein